MRKKVRKIALLGNLAVFVLLIFMMAFSWMLPLDRSLLGYHMSQAKTQMPDERLLIVAIDEKTLQELGSFNTWTRDMYATLLDNMYDSSAGPDVVAFDILFTSESEEAADQAFADALSRHKTVILPSYANMESEFARSLAASDTNELLQPEQWTHPIPRLAEHTERAHINARLDNDGVIRRTWLQLGEPDGNPMPSLAYKIAEIGGADLKPFLDLNKRSEILIDFNMMSSDFWTVPFIDVYNGDFPAENFENMLVFVGFTAAGYDTGPTTIETDMKLVYAHANIVHQLLQGDVVRENGKLVETLTAALMFALMITVAWRLRTLSSVAAALGAIALLTGIQYVLYYNFGFYFHIVEPIMALLLAYLVNITIKSFNENRQKAYITKQFGRYLSPDLVREIARSEQEITLGGSNRELSILFLDIRGFTTLSEKLQPEEVLDFLNTMFDVITRKALDNQGTIDKFIGDAAMILFNAPLDVADHEYCAVRSAWEIQQAMVEVRRSIEEKYGVSVSAGIGIHTGPVVVGNIGSFLRMDYTAIGDNVNIAARIESNTQPNQILVSEEVYERTKERFRYHCIGERVMKGKTVPVKLFEVLGPHN
ncbi:adenylate/guanylate cyclase domain-containing protein [Paenibacillaceae bacterium]|nr:adenylate/guanylate cyclase domain-containing protein [Paenibacillaceae bacterium]